MVVLKTLLVLPYCEAPETEQLEAQPSLKALYKPGILKKALLCICVIQYLRSLLPVGIIKLHSLVKRISVQQLMSHLLTSLHCPHPAPCRITFKAQRCQLWERFCNSSIWPLGTFPFKLRQLCTCLEVHQMARKLIR